MNNNDYNQNIQGSQLPCSPPIPSGEYTSYPADDIPSPYPAENFLYEPYATNDPGKSAATASMIFGICSIALFFSFIGSVGSVVAIVLSRTSAGKSHSVGLPQSTKARVGFICGIISLSMYVIFLAFCIISITK